MYLCVGAVPGTRVSGKTSVNCNGFSFARRGGLDMYDPNAFSRGHNNAHVYAKYARSRVGHAESGFKLMCNFAFTDASSGPFLWECTYFPSAGACFELVHVGETVALVEVFKLFRKRCKRYKNRGFVASALGCAHFLCSC